MFPLLCVQVCVGPGVKLESGTVLVARQQDDDDFGDEITDRPDGQPLGRHHMSITYSLGVDLEQDVDKISTFREYAWLVQLKQVLFNYSVPNIIHNWSIIKTVPCYVAL